MPVTLTPNIMSTSSAPVEQNAAVVVAIETETTDAERALLQAQLREARQAHAIQRASAEQSRRMGDCLRGFHDALLPLLNQPCMVIDREGCVSLWNDALAKWTAIAADAAIGRGLESLFPEEAAEALDAALQVGCYAAETAPANQRMLTPVPGIFSPSERLRGASFALLPLRRVPGCLESCLVLFQPAP